MKNFNRRFSIDKLKVLTWCLALTMLSSLFLPIVKVNADEIEPSESKEYVLSFDFVMPEASCFETILAKHRLPEQLPYEEAVGEAPENEDLEASNQSVEEIITDDLEDVELDSDASQSEAEPVASNFFVNYELHIEGQEQSLSQTVQFIPEENSWNGNACFDGIKIPFSDVEAQFYEIEDDGFVEEGQLHYNLYLAKSETEDKMILLLPKLSSYDDQGNVLAEDALLDVTNVQTVISPDTPAENPDLPPDPDEEPIEEEPDLTENEDTLFEALGQNNEPTRAGTAVYLGGVNASDDNDGLSSDKPVATFGKAKEIATDTQGITQIIVQGETALSGEVSLEGLDVTVIRADSYYGFLFRIKAGSEVLLKNITIDGNKDNNSYVGKSLILMQGNGEKTATLIISEGAVIQNNKINNNGFGGAILAQSNSIIKLTGGEVKNNHASYGGGICLFDSTLIITGQSSISGNLTDINSYTYGGGIYAVRSSIEMTGGCVQENEANYGAGICLNSSNLVFSDGIIQNNKFWPDEKDKSRYSQDSAGGGILAVSGSRIDMSNKAQIINNKSKERGGGISLGYSLLSKGSSLIMQGGTIAENTTKGCGGGIFVQAGDISENKCVAVISSGKIINNSATNGANSPHNFSGGGIYVNGQTDYYNGELYLTNAVISNNRSLRKGAGYAGCPCSKTEMYVTNGCAIFDNFRKSYTNDLFITNHEGSQLQHLGIPEYEIAKRMFAGIPYNWKTKDNEVLSLERYKNGLSSFSDSIYVYTDGSDSDLIDKTAAVLISGNYSEVYGGGIGSNGTVIFGKPGTTEVSVTKEWNDNNNAEQKRPESIEVELLAEFEGESYVIDSIVLNAGNQWQHTFEDLPTEMGGQPAKYSVREVSVSGYTGTVTGDMENGFIITNTPDTPDSPGTPPKETVPKVEIPLKITVHKEWVDQDNAKGLRPRKVTVFLYADGRDTGKYIFLEPEQNWTASFWELPEYEGDHKIVYTVKEEPLSNYDSRVSGDPENGFVVTNTLNLWPTENKEKAENLPRTGEQSGDVIWLSIAMLASGLALAIKKHKF